MTGRDTELGMGRRRGETSRRRMFALSGGAVLAALGTAACGRDGISFASGSPAAGSSSGPGKVSAPPASGVLAANVNQALEKIDYAELKAVSSTWIRGFYSMSDADQQNPATQTGFVKLLQAAGYGYGTVLTMKFQYQNKPIPTPGSPAMKTGWTRSWPRPWARSTS